MIKIDEKVDLSNKILEIDIESPIFNTMLHDLNLEIKRVIDKVFDEEFEIGEISLKLKLSINEDYKTYPKDDGYGGFTEETYKYRKPYFEHQVSTTLKKQYKQEGAYTEEKEVKFEDEQYYVVPIIEPQTSLFDREV